MRGDKNVEELNSILMQNNINHEVIDQGISKINNILLNAAKKASFSKRVKNNKKVNKKINTQEWYTKECKTRQKLLRQSSRALSTVLLIKQNE